MRRSTIFGTAFSALVVLAAVACRADTILVPQGLDVPLAFDQTVSSKTAKAGDTIQLHVVRDVMINGNTVIKHGTHVVAIITDVEHRKNFGVNAKLRLAFDPVKSMYGKNIDLQARSKGKYTGSRFGPCGRNLRRGAALLLGPVGLVGGYFRSSART